MPNYPPLPKAPALKIGAGPKIATIEKSPWLTESDWDEPSPSYIAQHTTGPISTRDDLTNQVRKHYLDIESRATAKIRAAEKESFQAHLLPVALKGLRNAKPK